MDAVWWLVINCCSVHFIQPSPGGDFTHYNGHNQGFGIEYRAADSVRLGSGFYLNSEYRTTLYGSLSYLPFKLSRNIRAGAFVAGVTGYENLGGHQINWLPGLQLSYEGKRLGVNVVGNPAAIGVQFKFPF